MLPFLLSLKDYLATFLTHTIPNIFHLSEPIEDAVHHIFIPALTDCTVRSVEERQLLALPVCLGGLGIQNPTNVSDHAFEASLCLTSPFVNAIIAQDLDLQVDLEEITRIKDAIKNVNRAIRAAQATTVYDALPRLLTPSDNALTWQARKGHHRGCQFFLLKTKVFHSTWGSFRDALSLRYGWFLVGTPTHCNCGCPFTTAHAMICPKGGFPTICHNELWDMTANLLTGVSGNVTIAPWVQPLSGEDMHLQSSITSTNARLDVHARGFWSTAQNAFFESFSPQCS